MVLLCKVFSDSPCQSDKENTKGQGGSTCSKTTKLLTVLARKRELRKTEDS